MQDVRQPSPNRYEVLRGIRETARPETALGLCPASAAARNSCQLAPADADTAPALGTLRDAVGDDDKMRTLQALQSRRRR